MNLTCSNTVIKYLMFLVNLIFVITGIIILAVGVTVKAYYYTYETFLDDKYFSLPNLLIATGSLIFFISFLGCYGAIKENWVILMAFSVLLGVIFIFEFSAGIAGYVLRDKTSSYLESKLTENMKNYNTSLAVAQVWDLIQEEFQCCGVRNYSDWSTTFADYSLPVSCCPNKTGTIGVFYCNAFQHTTLTSNNTPTQITTSLSPTSAESSSTAESESSNIPAESNTTIASTVATTPETLSTASDNGTSPGEQSRQINKRETFFTNHLLSNYAASEEHPVSTSSPYTTGCEAAFGSFVKKHAVNIGAVGMVLAVIQLFGILFSCHMARQVKNGYYST